MLFAIPKRLWNRVCPYEMPRWFAVAVFPPVSVLVFTNIFDQPFGTVDVGYPYLDFLGSFAFVLITVLAAFALATFAYNRVRLLVERRRPSLADKGQGGVPRGRS